MPGTLDREELVAVLEECGVSVKGFDGLRSDSYEKHLAGRSLVELEAFYRRLVYPSIGYGKIRQQCLPWGPESQYHGKLPTVKTLIDIKERILLEQAVRTRMKAKKLVGALGSGQAEGEAKESGSMIDSTMIDVMEYFKVAMEILAEELLVAKLEGKPVMENLKVLDRLVRVAGLRLRERKDNREQARFEWEEEDRHGQNKAESEKRESGNEGDDRETSQESEYDPEALIERVFGANPFKTKKDDEGEDADDDQREEDAINTAQPINNHGGTEDTENKAEGGKRESGNGVDSQESEVRSQEPEGEEGEKMGLVEPPMAREREREGDPVAGGVGGRPCIRLEE